MIQNRPDPDKLLASLKKDEAKKKRGKLRIFFGMCPGVGKTYAMLEAARQRQAEGLDVLVGIVETHGRKETEKLLDGLAIAAKIDRPYRGTVLKETDLDTILAIRPRLAIMDELAHTNAPGSRHPKRYQDILEILDAGIDVYSTLNVQHIESRAEAVHQINGIRVHETVPDSILDEADEITLIDIAPDQLRQRLKDGLVYLGARAATAADNFFRAENLIALREMALRVTAEHVNQDLREIMAEQRIRGPWKSGECLMAAVAPTPFSESLIRWTRRSAASLNAPWVAVYVEKSERLDEEGKKRLEKNLSLARQLGAQVIVTSGTDIAETLLSVARENNVTQICIGKPAREPFWKKLVGGTLVQKLIEQSGDIDVHMVRIANAGEKTEPFRKIILAGQPQEYGMVLAIIIGVTLCGRMIEQFAGYSSVSLVYLLAVVVSSLWLSRWPVFLLGAASALFWNYLFLPPRFTFHIQKTDDIIMFAMYFIIALFMGHITARLREREQAERRQEQRVNALYRLTRTAAFTLDTRQAISNAISELEKMLKVKAAVFLQNDTGHIDYEKPWYGTLVLTGKEKSVAIWAFQKRQSAGRFTDTLREAQNFYFPLISFEKSIGLVVIMPEQNKVWSLDQRNLVESVGGLITVIFEKELLVRMTADKKIKAESEKLQAALLDSVSHELKTPLTVIAGSMEHLEKQELNTDEFKKLAAEIRQASIRLLQTVNGLLDMTRIDSGYFQLTLQWQDIRDVLNAALDSLKDQLGARYVCVKYGDALSLAKIDAKVIRQIITNLISNAANYAPPDTAIEISVQKDQNRLVIKVMDEGPGIAEEDKEKIFDKFYRGRAVRPGGLGLGLSIAKRLAEVHGGSLEVRNREGKGTMFTLTIPVDFYTGDEKLPPHE